MIRVVLVDDEPMVLIHLRTILAQSEDVEVVGTASDGEEAVEVVPRHEPNVVLMDLRMPGLGGLAAIEHLQTLPHRPAIIALTTFDGDEYVLKALRAGATGFLVKSTPPEDLINLVRVAADGHAVFSLNSVRQLVTASSSEQNRAHEALRRTEALTGRELDVLRGLGAGRSNADIAERLRLSEATVKSYVSRLMIKLDCANRTQAGLLAHEAGLVDEAP